MKMKKLMIMQRWKTILQKVNQKSKEDLILPSQKITLGLEITVPGNRTYASMTKYGNRTCVVFRASEISPNLLP